LTTLQSWKLFFTRVLLVPPNRFRPAAIVGEMISDHPQNVHLKRILTCNSKIRLLQNTTSSTATSLSALIGGAADDVLDIDVPAQPTDDTLSRLISEWIELQVNVNCYIDSSKDPNPLGNKAAPMGLKQVLERKEGLFRRHMMGKRVNFCARSVISPDPYIGMNEIGIPLRFAKELHYAVPVTEWNVKHLRKLVERGPHEYPGK
jgi:DNA-directed RNA polymerase I subunit RPA1